MRIDLHGVLPLDFPFIIFAFAIQQYLEWADCVRYMGVDG